MKSAFIYGTPDFSAINKAAKRSQNNKSGMTSIELVGQRNKINSNSLKTSEKKHPQITLVYLGRVIIYNL